ncbi:MAG: M56 family metallopeptidase [Flavobacteriaceae bacterium]
MIKTKHGHIYHLNQTKIAFTYLNSIFIGEDLNTKEQARILDHEYVHKKQKHSLDLIYYEILKIIFWFHPAVYCLQNQMRLVHEYIADAAVAKMFQRKNIMKIY